MSWRRPGSLTSTFSVGARPSRNRAWHLVARASDDLPPTARLFVDHLTGSGHFTLE